MVDSVYVSTDFVEAEERNDFWREVTRPVFETVPFKGDRDLLLGGSIRSRVIGSLLIGTTTFNRQCYIRDARLCARGGLDHYLLQVITSGTLQGDFNGTLVRADVGDICITDFSQTLKSQVESGSTLSMTLPRQLLDKTIGSRNLHGIVLKRHWPITPLIVAYLHDLHALEASLPPAQAAAAEEAAVALLSAALKGCEPEVFADASAPGASLLGAGLRQRIVEFVAEHIYLPELSPDFLCRRFHVSRAHLYRAFARDGGVAKMLRDVRLDAAYRELTQATGASRSITEIAYSLGFSSSNQLLRSFRTRFGVTPSDARGGRATAGEDRLSDSSRQNMQLHAHFARLSDKLQSR